jgi:ubiquinone/menaquinone biosynthesis C-methylase UbiE
VGLDPAGEMLLRASERGIDVLRGVAESLPFRDETFDTALVVTTICFVDDIPQTLAEARRVLRPNGSLVIGYIDRDSPVGRIYQKKKSDNPFYQEAVFVSTDELVDALEAAGFTDFDFVQTIYHWPEEIDEPESVMDGYGEGSFVGIRATR